MTNNTNLLQETREAMTDAEKAPTDVAFVGSRDGRYACSWAEFEQVADVDYYAGFGGAEIAGDLVVVFRDGSYLDRGEYDGSEWWNFNQTPTMRSDAKRFLRVVSENWDSTIAGMNP